MCVCVSHEIVLALKAETKVETKEKVVAVPLRFHLPVSLQTVARTQKRTNIHNKLKQKTYLRADEELHERVFRVDLPLSVLQRSNDVGEQPHLAIRLMNE
jgi:hypothetical protein